MTITCGPCLDRRNDTGQAHHDSPFAFNADGTINWKPISFGIPADGTHVYQANQHRTVEAVRRCALDNTNTFPCTMLVKYDIEGETYTRDCGAIAWATDRGTVCDAGHEHVTAETRHAESWDYAEDDGDAEMLMRAGLGVVGMDGGSYTWGGTHLRAGGLAGRPA